MFVWSVFVTLEPKDEGQCVCVCVCVCVCACVCVYIYSRDCSPLLHEVTFAYCVRRYRMEQRKNTQPVFCGRTSDLSY